MSARITRTGQDNWQGQRPSTDADRRHAFGPIEPMDTPTLADKLRLGLPTFGVLLALIAAVTMAGVAGGWW